MFKDGILDRILAGIRRFIPKSIFRFFQPAYHTILAYLGALIYGFPSHSMYVIGITGTKGKSTTTYLISEILFKSGLKVAACGSLGYRILDKEWPNTLKMTMPGRFKLQKFLRQAKNAGCTHVVLEVTSEGIAQKRIKGIKFDMAVFTSLHREHIESHGSFENYYAAKQELFKAAKGVHVLNADDPYVDLFSKFKADKKIFYGIRGGDLRAERISIQPDGISMNIYGTDINLAFGGKFNVYNAMAALSATAMVGVDLPTSGPIISKVKGIEGRMQFIQKEPFGVVVDYAHTPDSLKAVYSTLKESITGNLICVLGAAGGGRDKWKRPEFGAMAAQFCDMTFLTNEDPYEEDPLLIIEEIESGLVRGNRDARYEVVLDRKEAIGKAIKSAKPGDMVVITGKGSEVSMAISGGKKIPWSDAEIATSYLD